MGAYYDENRPIIRHFFLKGMHPFYHPPRIFILRDTPIKTTPLLRIGWRTYASGYGFVP
jgi:hypothetical protein